MRVVIVEGGRGTGKSTISRAIREKISEITLVNATGFHDNGKEGLDKITDYYNGWLRMISQLNYHNSTFVFDRFFFTERVFSELYKNYDFDDYYEEYLEWLCSVAEVDVIFFTIDNEEELSKRLHRDKVPFANVKESVDETLKQQKLYSNIMTEFERVYTGETVRLHRINTSNKTLEIVQEEVLKIIRKET